MNSQILFGSWKSNEYKYLIPLFSPNYLNIWIVRIIRDKTERRGLRISVWDSTFYADRIWNLNMPNQISYLPSQHRQRQLWSVYITSFVCCYKLNYACPVLFSDQPSSEAYQLLRPRRIRVCYQWYKEFSVYFVRCTSMICQLRL